MTSLLCLMCFVPKRMLAVCEARDRDVENCCRGRGRQ